MTTSPTPSTPEPSSPLVESPKISPVLRLASSASPIPSTAVSAPCPDVEPRPSNFKTAGTPNSSVSPTTTSTHSALFASSSLSPSPPSPGVNVTDAAHRALTVDDVTNGTLVGSVERNPNCAPEGSPPKTLPNSIYDEFQPPTTTRNITTLAPPSSCSDTHCSPSNCPTSHIQDSSRTPLTAFTNIINVPRLTPPSPLPSFLEDIPEFYLPPSVWG